MCIPISVGYPYIRTERSVARTSRSTTVPMGARKVQIDTSSALWPDASSIYHIACERIVFVELHRNASCSNPVLRCRLSGPSLSAFALHPISDVEKTRLQKYFQRSIRFNNILVGRYGSQVLPGKHFVEIITLYCNGWENHSYDFSSVCLQDPSKHRVSTLGSSVNILAKDGVSTSVPLWANQRLVSNANGARTIDRKESLLDVKSIGFRPMYTRYQPFCPQGSDPTCATAADTTPFLNYTFFWPQHSDPKILLSNQLSLNVTQNERSRVCFMGASHTREIRNHLYSVFGDKIIDSVAAFDVEARYTDYVEANAKMFVEKHTFEKHTCTSLVIGIGQWPAGWPEGRPQLFNEYKNNMEGMLQHLIKLKHNVEQNNSGQPSSPGKTLKLYLRSMHYNALGNSMTGCPPREWRNPFVIDGYNGIAKQLTLEFMGSVEYIDTDFIIGPMWDSPDDWCHYRNEAGKQDALYLLARVLLPSAFYAIGEKQPSLCTGDFTGISHFLFGLWVFVAFLARTFEKQKRSEKRQFQGVGKRIFR